jgi:hypothetical protein
MIIKTLFVAVAAVFVLGLTALADWVPQDGHKMHFPQLPDSTGWAVCATMPVNLADDFMCSETGWIKAIHFWGGWRHAEDGEVLLFNIRLHADIPADQSGTGYSVPGAALIEWIVTTWSEVPHNPPTLEGWYNPMTQFVYPDDHNVYTQYNVFLPGDDWFHQDSGTIYWLSISAEVADPINSQWGWKSSVDHWNDNATFGDYFDPVFEIMYEPAVVDTLVDSFFITIDDFGNPINWGGVGHWSTGWAGWGLDTEPWWLIWYYDHPVDYDRWKQVTLEFDAAKYASSPSPGDVEICVAWSIDTWPSVGYPPPPQMADSIDHVIVLAESVTSQTVSFTLPMEIWEYNPEWVAVGVHATNSDNVEITNGAITHICAPKEIERLDLAFVITGNTSQQSGACCYPGAAGGIECVETTQTECEEALGGTFLGAGTDCLGDGDDSGVDDACEGGCCQIRGDVNHDGSREPDIADLIYLVTYMFQGGPEPPCNEPYGVECPDHYFAETDVNGDGSCTPDITDLIYLVTYMFQDGPPLVPCRTN